jgi:hypothetical protein
MGPIRQSVREPEMVVTAAKWGRGRFVGMPKVNGVSRVDRGRSGRGRAAVGAVPLVVPRVGRTGCPLDRFPGEKCCGDMARAFVPDCPSGLTLGFVRHSGDFGVGLLCHRPHPLLAVDSGRRRFGPESHGPQTQASRLQKGAGQSSMWSGTGR